MNMGAERRYMTYNPEVHHRKSIRLKEYDYSKNGMYFITICTQNRRNLFWNNNINVNDNCRVGACSAQRQKLNHLGEIIQKEWLGITQRYSNVQLGEYIIMPNYLHGIIILENFIDSGGASPAPTNKFKNMTVNILNTEQICGKI